jgi:hypothetical protein
VTDPSQLVGGNGGHLKDGGQFLNVPRPSFISRSRTAWQDFHPRILSKNSFGKNSAPARTLLPSSVRRLARPNGPPHRVSCIECEDSNSSGPTLSPWLSAALLPGVAPSLIVRTSRDRVDVSQARRGGYGPRRRDYHPHFDGLPEYPKKVVRSDRETCLRGKGIHAHDAGPHTSRAAVAERAALEAKCAYSPSSNP